MANDVVHVVPKRLADITALKESFSDHSEWLDYIRKVVNDLSSKLEEREQEGERICYPGYKLGKIELWGSEEKPSLLVTGLAGYDLITPLVLTQAIMLVEQWLRRHDQNIAEYKAFDEWQEKFDELTDRIRRHGGRLELDRPLFRVKLPDLRSMTMTNLELIGSETTYLLVVQALDDLDDDAATIRERCSQCLTPSEKGCEPEGDLES